MNRAVLFCFILGVSVLLHGCAEDPLLTPTHSKASIVLEEDGESGPSGPEPQQMIIHWAGRVLEEFNLVNSGDALGAPDGLGCGFFGGSPAHGVFSQFDAGYTRLSRGRLAAFLGVPKSALAGMDFICFEHNGTPGLHFESADWTFDDGTNTLTFAFDHDNPDATDGIVAVREIGNMAYARLFKFTNSYPTGDNQCLLFDLDGLDLSSPDFQVTISAFGFTGDPRDPLSPDPDAMGIIRHIRGSLSAERPGSGKDTSVGM